jgi:hypothetical protein
MRGGTTALAPQTVEGLVDPESLTPKGAKWTQWRHLCVTTSYDTTCVTDGTLSYPTPEVRVKNDQMLVSSVRSNRIPTTSLDGQAMAATSRYRASRDP